MARGGQAQSNPVGPGTEVCSVHTEGTYGLCGVRLCSVCTAPPFLRKSESRAAGVCQYGFPISAKIAIICLVVPSAGLPCAVSINTHLICLYQHQDVPTCATRETRLYALAFHFILSLCFLSAHRKHQCFDGVQPPGCVQWLSVRITRAESAANCSSSQECSHPSFM
jgi:hypothetical protein